MKKLCSFFKSISIELIQSNNLGNVFCELARLLLLSLNIYYVTSNLVDIDFFCHFLNPIIYFQRFFSSYHDFFYFIHSLSLSFFNHLIKIKLTY